MRAILPAFLLTLFLGCNESAQKRISENKELFQKDIPDTANNQRASRDFEFYQYTNKLTERLSLTNMHNGTDDVELRFWDIGSLTDPIILYVLKRYKNNWTIFHYQIYRGDSWGTPEPKVDSLIVKPSPFSDTANLD